VRCAFFLIEARLFWNHELTTLVSLRTCLAAEDRCDTQPGKAHMSSRFASSVRSSRDGCSLRSKTSLRASV
jgi:hypothetical protein